MNNIPISDGEVEVMKVLWQHSPRTLPKLVEAVMQVNAWKNVTVKTLLSRLIKKGAVSQSGTKRSYLYSPLVSEDEYLESVSDEFLERSFNASPGEMLAFFVKCGKINSDDLALLQGRIGDLRDE